MILDHTIVLTNEDFKKIFAEELNSTWTKFFYLIETKYPRISHKTLWYDWFDESRHELRGLSLDELNKIKPSKTSLFKAFQESNRGFEFKDDALEILEDGGILQFYYPNDFDPYISFPVYLFMDKDGEIKEFDHSKTSRDYLAVKDYLKYRNKQ